MLKQVSFIAAVALSFTAATQASAQDASAETVVARVGETEITLGEVIIARTQLPQQYNQLPPEVLFDGLIDQLIQQQLLADALEDVPARIDLTLKNDRRALMAGEVVNAIRETAITDEAIQAAYDAQYADAETGLEFNASHLLVETEEEAIAAKARIDEGAAFADVAREVSTGPTGPNGGDLGWFGPGQMVAEFEETILALEIGEVSEPFQTSFGWHVATLDDQREKQPPALEEVRGQLSQQIEQEAVTARLEELSMLQEVERPEEGDFDPALINNTDLLMAE